MRGVTRVKRWERRLILDGQISLTSSSFHPLGVKGEKGGKCVNIRKKQQLSLLLSLFHSHPPAQYEFARIRVRERGTVRIVETCRGSFPADFFRRRQREQPRY